MAIHYVCDQALGELGEHCQNPVRWTIQRDGQSNYTVPGSMVFSAPGAVTHSCDEHLVSLIRLKTSGMFGKIRAVVAST